MDNHLHAQLDDYPLPNLTIEGLEAFIKAVRPSRLTVFAIGHDGLAQYPTELVKVAPNLRLDLVGLWREVARRNGVQFAIYVSTLRNDTLVSQHRQWERTRLDGQPAGKIDHTSPYLEQWLKPVLTELYARYKPDGFFFDGDYWAVGESIGEFRALAARSKWPSRGEDALSTLSPAEHRLLTVETYRSYLSALGEHLMSLDGGMESSVNLAFTFRHPTSPPPGLKLVTSDLPPFYGALEAWIETSVVLPQGSHRDLVVPLYAEPEGGGRKYPKTVEQVIHEAAPLIANSENFHVYFPMSRNGEIDQTYVGCLNEVRGRLEDLQKAAGKTHLEVDYDVLCLSDSDTLLRSQDFSYLRGAFMAASAAGLNVGIGATDRCLERLRRLRLIVLPTGRPESEAAKALVSAAISHGVSIVGPFEPDFAEMMLGANWTIDDRTTSLLLEAYRRSSKATLWSALSIRRPTSTFVRGAVDSDGGWRLFLWNGLQVGAGLGRHVVTRGAGYAGRHKVILNAPLNLKRVWGQARVLHQSRTEVELDLVGAFASLEGDFGDG